MQVSQAFTDYAQKRLDTKLDKFFGDEADAKIVLTEQKNQIIVELTVRYSGMIYRAEQTAVDKNDALDAAVDKIIRQIRKNKTRLEKKLKESAFKQDFEDTVEETDISVVRTKKVEMRPMTTEEAILQMDMLGHGFFVYKNADNGKTEVVYKRADEGYAVLQPED